MAASKPGWRPGMRWRAEALCARLALALAPRRRGTAPRRAAAIVAGCLPPKTSADENPRLRHRYRARAHRRRRAAVAESGAVPARRGRLRLGVRAADGLHHLDTHLR